MRLVSYDTQAAWSPGIVLGDEVIDLNAALAATADFAEASYSSMREFLDAEGGRLEEVANAIHRAATDSTFPVVGSLA